MTIISGAQRKNSSYVENQYAEIIKNGVGIGTKVHKVPKAALYMIRSGRSEVCTCMCNGGSSTS